jgi:hypothetical protein
MKKNDRIERALFAPSYIGRVLNTLGIPVGTCFQVAPKVLVTAWHVIDHLDAGAAGDIVEVDALDRGIPAVSARVVRTDRLHDLAVLIAEEPLADDVARLTATDGLALSTDVAITGVPYVADRGHSYQLLTAVGLWRGPVMRDEQIALGRLSCSDMLPGMSGAPVRRISDNAVVGVVSARYNSADGWLRDSVWIARIEDLAPLLAGFADVDIANMEFGGDLHIGMDTYLRALHRRLGQVAPYHPPTVSFDDLRIPARVYQHAVPTMPLGSANMFPIDFDGTPTRQIYDRKGGSQKLQDLKPGESLTARWSFVRDAIRVGVILGDPGYGKSWLLRHEGRVAASEALISWPQDPVRTCIPLHMRVVTLARALFTQIPESASLQEFPYATMTDIAKAAVTATEAELRPELDRSLPESVRREIQGRVEAGENVTILLDGWDEVHDSRHRAFLRDILTRLARQIKSGSRLLLTSRIVGFDNPIESYGLERFADFELISLSDSDIEKYADVWLGKDSSVRYEFRKALISSPTLRTLCRVPLLNGFCCWLAKDGVLPASRAALYEQFLFKLLRNAWRTPENVDDTGRILLKLRLLEEIAWSSTAATSEAWQDTVTADQILQCVSNFDGTSELQRTAPFSRSTILSELTEHDGLMTAAWTPAPGIDAGTVPYLFLHRTLQEYLVSRRLGRLYSGSDQDRLAVLQLVKSHVGSHADWSQVAPLLAGYLAEVGQTPQPLINELWDAIRASDPFHDRLFAMCEMLLELPRDLAFDYLPAALPSMLALISHSVVQDERYPAARYLSSLPGDECARFVRACLTSTSWRVRAAICASLMGRREYQTELLARLNDPVILVATRAAISLAPNGASVLDELIDRFNSELKTGSSSSLCAEFAVATLNAGAGWRQVLAPLVHRGDRATLDKVADHFTWEDPTLFEWVIQRRASDDEVIRIAVAHVLRYFQDNAAEAAKVLVTMGDDEMINVAGAASESLQHLCFSKRGLFTSLSADWESRATSADVLVRAKCALMLRASHETLDCRPLLHRLLTDPDPGVRIMAALSLIELEPSEPSARRYMLDVTKKGNISGAPKFLEDFRSDNLKHAAELGLAISQEIKGKYSSKLVLGLLRALSGADLVAASEYAARLLATAEFDRWGRGADQRELFWKCCQLQESAGGREQISHLVGWSELEGIDTDSATRALLTVLGRDPMPGVLKSFLDSVGPKESQKLRSWYLVLRGIRFDARYYDIFRDPGNIVVTAGANNAIASGLATSDTWAQNLEGAPDNATQKSASLCAPLTPTWDIQSAIDCRLLATETLLREFEITGFQGSLTEIDIALSSLTAMTSLLQDPPDWLEETSQMSTSLARLEKLLDRIKSLRKVLHSRAN